MTQNDFSQNYFDLFGMPVDFQLDEKELHDAHRRLQSVYHPDRFVNSTDQEKRLVVQKAAWINEAYEILKNPVKRSRYMLTLGGMNLKDDSETTADKDFLLEQIELREEMDQCHSCQDPMRCCDHITGKLDQRSREYAADFEAFYNQGQLNEALKVSKKMQFVQRVIEQIDDFQFDLEDQLV